jgi:hypothetical protein
MKTKISILLSCFFLISFFSHSQSSIGIKVYQNTDFFKAEYYGAGNYQYKTDHHRSFNRFSVAINVVTKRNFLHEVELFVPELSKSLENIQFPLNYKFTKTAPTVDKATVYAFRYDVSKVVTDLAKRISVVLGAGVNPYRIKIDYSSQQAFVYSRRQTMYGVAVNIIPGVQYSVSKRFMMDLSIPFRIYNYKRERMQVDNPAIPISQQTKESDEGKFFENVYTIRFGLRYGFGKMI